VNCRKKSDQQLGKTSPLLVRNTAKRFGPNQTDRNVEEQNGGVEELLINKDGQQFVSLGDCPTQTARKFKRRSGF